MAREALENTDNSQRDLEGKVAVVTGAAGGIGRAAALLLESRGAVVIAEDVKPAVKELANDRIVPFVGDVALEDTARRVVALAVERFGRLDVLVNNAARILYKEVTDMTLQEWDAILSVNLTASSFTAARRSARWPRARAARL